MKKKRSYKGLNVTLIHQLKKKIKDVESEKKKLQDIMDNMADGVTIVDMKGKILFVNRAGLTQHGYTKKEVIGKTPADLLMEKILWCYKTAAFRQTLGSTGIFIKTQGRDIVSHER
jgi:PAS domain S-box-containing protein